MTTNLDDLLPLFLGEARDRLEKVSGVLGRGQQDAASLGEVKRQLHALKGACRMMRLTELSELCHEAESTLEVTDDDSIDQLVQALDHITTKVEELAAEQQSSAPKVTDEPKDDAKGGPSKSQRTPEVSAAATSDEGYRVRSERIEELADQAARLRVMSRSVETAVEDSFRLAQLAERGVRERKAQQVLATLATMLRQHSVGLERHQREMAVLAKSQLESLVRLQVQPMKPFLLGLARHARELARQLGKEVKVVVSPGDTQLDKGILRALEEAFLHLVRNAIDHGIESSAERKAAGKPVKGNLVLEAESAGSQVLIRVADDGKGLDLDAIVKQAVDSGEITVEEAAELDEEAIAMLACRPGFTTRTSATEVSGRGVGLDAVSESVRSVGGVLRLRTQPGAGVTVAITVPVSRVGERVLIAEIGESRIGVPSSVVRQLKRVPVSALVDEQDAKASGRDLLPENTMSLIDLSHNPDELTLLVCRVAGREIGLVVNTVIAEEEVVLRPVPSIRGVPDLYDGLATLGSGQPLPILSLHQIAAEASVTLGTVGLEERSRSLRVLLADDSPVTREMLRRLLEGGGIHVVSAGNGDEALVLLAGSQFDCLVTDVEMPVIDGLELTRRVRASEELKNLPVIVVSTRDRPEDRLAGLEAGADAYLAKQSFDAQELVALVRSVGLGT